MPEPTGWTWLPLDASKLEKHERTEIDGVEVNVFMSPYDVPEAVRGRYDVAVGRLLIEFKYFDEEKPVVDEPHGDHIVLRVGKNSGRLLGIQLDADALKAKQVGLRVFVEQVRKAINELSNTRSKDPSRIRNYQVTEEVITDHSAELFKELVEA